MTSGAFAAIASKMPYSPPVSEVRKRGSSSSWKKQLPMAIVMSGASFASRQYGCARTTPSRRSPSPSIR